MQRLLTDKRLAALAVVVLLAVALAGQSVADGYVRADRSTAAGRVIGHAGFAYLTGLRTFVAAVLWNRLDKQFDTYYSSLDRSTFLLPTIRAVVALDPQFVQAYYVGEYLVARKGKVSDGLVLAEEGMRNNPDSGLLRVSYAQMLWLFGKQPAKAAAVALPAFDEKWANDAEKFQGYRIMASLFKAAKKPAEEQRALSEYRRLKALLESRGQSTAAPAQ